MNKPPRKRRSAWSFRRFFGLGGASLLFCVVAVGTVYYVFGRGDSDRRNLPSAPKFIEGTAAAAETPVTSEKDSPPAGDGSVGKGIVADATAGKGTGVKKASSEDDAPFGLPLNVVLDNIPATPAALAAATPLSAIPDSPKGYVDDLVREHEELEKQKQ